MSPALFRFMAGFGLSRGGILFFLCHWVCLGFFMGTLTLMGPVRWLANYSRSHGWPESKEKALVFVFIGLLAIISFLCARLLAAKTAAASGKFTKACFLTGSLSLFAISLWFWLTPKMMIDAGLKGTSETVSGTEFVFGPYPDKEKILELKEERFTAVISLLSPAVVPFEPVLISKEAALAKEAGVELIHIPMLPWISSNNQIRDKLEKIVEKGAGKYYVHCYLGKDRMNVFKKILSSLPGAIRLRELNPQSVRTLRDITKFERGGIVTLEPDVFFTPYPTDEEFFGYIMNGSIKTLVCLLNPDNIEDAPWIVKEKAAAAQHQLNFMNHPWKALSPKRKEEVVKALKGLERPMVIHAFKSASPECAEFIEIYKKTGGR